MSDESNLPDDPKQRVQWTYEAENEAALAKRYDEWAKVYDEDLTGTHQYIAPQKSVDVLAGLIEPFTDILDAGAGTGLVGELLSQRGFPNLYAIDYSEGMLAKAKAKGVYKTTEQADMNQSLRHSDNSFGAVICVGTLTYVKPRVLSEFARITKPGGFVVYTLKTDTYVSAGFRGVENELCDYMVWKRVSVSDPFLALPATYPDLEYRIHAWQVK